MLEICYMNIEALLRLLVRQSSNWTAKWNNGLVTIDFAFKKQGHKEVVLKWVEETLKLNGSRWTNLDLSIITTSIIWSHLIAWINEVASYIIRPFCCPNFTWCIDTYYKLKLKTH